jgi:hypothetical protein
MPQFAIAIDKLTCLVLTITFPLLRFEISWFLDLGVLASTRFLFARSSSGE